MAAVFHRIYDISINDSKQAAEKCYKKRLPLKNEQYGSAAKQTKEKSSVNLTKGQGN